MEVMSGRTSLLASNYGRKTKSTDSDAEIVPDTEKVMLWAVVKRHFSFPEDKEEIFKDWVMKKMAIAFQTFKKNLNKDYVRKGLTPDFEKNFNVYEISISPGIRIEEAETETRLKEKDGGAYHHHLIVPGW